MWFQQISFFFFFRRTVKAKFKAVTSTFMNGKDEREWMRILIVIVCVSFSKHYSTPKFIGLAQILGSFNANIMMQREPSGYF